MFTHPGNLSTPPQFQIPKNNPANTLGALGQITSGENIAHCAMSLVQTIEKVSTVKL